jgi:hypothetical protein
VGAPWLAAKDVTEQCVALGLLEPSTVDGMEPGSPDSITYTLTPKGRGALEGGQA